MIFNLIKVEDKTKKLLIKNEIVYVTSNAIFFKDYVYILPKVDGTSLINGITFVRKKNKVWMENVTEE